MLAKKKRGYDSPALRPVRQIVVSLQRVHRMIAVLDLKRAQTALAAALAVICRLLGRLRLQRQRGGGGRRVRWRWRHGDEGDGGRGPASWSGGSGSGKPPVRVGVRAGHNDVPSVPACAEGARQHVRVAAPVRGVSWHERASVGDCRGSSRAYDVAARDGSVALSTNASL